MPNNQSNRAGITMFIVIKTIILPTKWDCSIFPGLLTSDLFYKEIFMLTSSPSLLVTQYFYCLEKTYSKYGHQLLYLLFFH